MLSNAMLKAGKSGLPFNRPIQSAESCWAFSVGLYEFSKRAEDVGRFKAPALRNIALTAPYMHDGSAATLSDVPDHYARGGRTIVAGSLKGVGHDKSA
jgi:cytochrome c peroxidase